MTSNSWRPMSTLEPTRGGGVVPVQLGGQGRAEQRHPPPPSRYCWSVNIEPTATA